MLKPQEVFHIAIAMLIFAFALSFAQGAGAFLVALLYALIIIGINIIAKKAIAYYFETDIRIRTWQWQRYWFSPASYFKAPVPAGMLLPFVLSLISLGYVKWLAFLQFDSRPLKEKAVKRHYGAHFSELVEKHLAFIAFAGIFGNIILAVAASLLNLNELAKYSIYYGIFNILPISQLDGTKLFFWSWRYWLFALALLLIAFFAIVLPLA